MGKLTDRGEATGVTLNNSIIHVVNTDDTTQSPSGSSYKSDLGQILSLSPRVTGGTYNTFTESIDFSGTTLFTPFSVDVSDLLDDTNTFTTGATLNGTILEFDRNDTLNAYGVDLSGLNYWTSGSSGNFSVKVVNDSGLDATGNYSHAEGFLTIASGERSHAEGWQTNASGFTSHAEGGQTKAFGSYSHAEGFRTIASGNYSHAEGQTTTASGNTSHAEGRITIAGGDYSHAEGFRTTASGDYSHVGGKGVESFKPVAQGRASFVHQETTNGAFGAIANNSVVLGGQNNNIDFNSDNSSIFGGTNNRIINATKSVIIGGNSISGTTADTVYVPNLNINYTPSNDNTLTQILVRASDGTVKYKDINSFTDMTVTGGTYDANTGIATFANNTGGTFDVFGFLTGMTDFYTTNATLNGTTLEFDRNDLSNAYSVDLSGLTSSFTGQSLSQTLSNGNNTGGNDIITDIDDVIISVSGGTLLDLRSGGVDGFTVLGQPSATFGGKGGFGDGGGVLFLGPFGVTLCHDGGSFDDFYLYTEKDNYGQLAKIRKTDSTYYGFNLYGDNTFQNFSTGVSIKDNETNSFTTSNRNNPAIIIGSKNSTINSGITNSVIVGGQNITAAQNNTVYVDNLNINTLGTGTSVNNLGIDSNGNVVVGDVGIFTGNTSGNCITDLYVSNLYGCSPITVWDNLTLSGSVIDSQGGGYLDLRYSNSDGRFYLGNDNGSYSDTFIQGENGYLEISAYDPSARISIFTDGGNAGFVLTNDTSLFSNDISLYTDTTSIISTPSGGAGNNTLGINNDNIFLRGNSKLNITVGNHNSVGIGSAVSDLLIAVVTGTSYTTDSLRETNPSILSSQNSTIQTGIKNSVALGGYNLNVNTDNTAYVDNLNISTLGTGTSVNNLGIDSNGNVVAGDVGIFTGNTSGDCISDIFVSNIHSCSPLNINPLDEGNVYFGSTSGFTVDVSNGGNIYTKGDYVLQTEIDSSTIVSVLESGNNKGYAQLIDYTGTTGVFTLNTNTSGSTGIVFGETGGNVGFIRYHGSDFSRNAPSAVNGDAFYKNKMLISPGTTSNGTVINIASTTNNGRLWFEQNGNSPMLIAGGTSGGDMRLGIALNPNGTEIPTAKLQVGGTGTTGTFRYIDGNEENGYVLTSDANGNATWAETNMVNTNYNPTGGTITTSDNYVRYNLTGDTVVNLPSTAGSTPTPKEGQVLNIIKIGPNKLRLETSVPHAIQGAPDGSSPTPLTSGNSLDLLSANTVSVTLIYDGGLDSWVVMSCSDYNEITYNETL
jgi:hypothetical protein